MPIRQSDLRSAATNSASVAVAKSLNEAEGRKSQTAFLCHSHKDKDLALGLQVLLLQNGWNVYIDWMDEELSHSPDKATASKIKTKIRDLNWFLFLATANSTESRWCPWEIGYADGVKKYERILIVPTKAESGTWYGNEYLQLYRQITEASNLQAKRTGYAVFSPYADNDGEWIDQLTI